MVLLYSSNVYVDNISAILFFLKSKLTVSSNICFSSKLKGEAIAKALIVSNKLCFSRAFQLITNPLLSNNCFKSLKINSNLLKKSINIIGNNKVVNMFLQKFADSGIRY